MQESIPDEARQMRNVKTWMADYNAREKKETSQPRKRRNGNESVFGDGVTQRCARAPSEDRGERRRHLGLTMHENCAELVVVLGWERGPEHQHAQPLVEHAMYLARDVQFSPTDPIRQNACPREKAHAVHLGLEEKVELQDEEIV